MANTSVVIELPVEAEERLRQLAKVTDQSLESVVLQTIVRYLPPSESDLPPEMRAELAVLPTLPDHELEVVARAERPQAEWRRHQWLLQEAEIGDLTDGEKDELNRLHDLADRFMFRRSYALALLKWRGRPLPIGAQ